MGAKSFNYASWLRSKPNPRGQFISPENANILANLATSVFLINIKGNNWEIVKNHNRTDQLFKNGKLLSSGGGIDNQKGRIKALTGVDVNEVTISTSQFLLGSTTGSATFTPPFDPTNFFTISSGANVLKDNRFSGRVSVILNPKGADQLEPDTTAFLVTEIFESGTQRRWLHKVNTLIFNFGTREHIVEIKSNVNITSREIFYRQFMTLVSSRAGQIPENRASNVWSQTLLSQTVTPPPDDTKECNCNGVIKIIPKFTPCPECKIIPPDNGNGNGEIKERDLFQTAILLLLGGGLVLGMRGDKR